MSMKEGIVIRLTGDSGDGVQIIGEQLTITAAMSGKEVRTLPDFPAEIRAPQGTVAGVSGFQLAMAEKAIFTAGETIDVLVALNPAALQTSLEALRLGGLLFINEESFTPKDWEKASLHPSFLQEVQEHYQVIALPLLTNTQQAVKVVEGLTQAQIKKTKNFYILGLVLWLFDLTTEKCLDFIEKKFTPIPLIARANALAMLAGYNYGLTLELSRQHFIVGQATRVSGEYRQITGVEAVGLAVATVAVGTHTPLLVAGYPITPASAILQECARLSDYGVQLFQAEDEIAAICACLGASFGGFLALTCTSGPGLDLKSESLGLAVMSELPLVLIDVQRAGASTGLPTKTGQSDLYQALYGRHGEAPLPVLAATSPAQVFQTVIDAFTIATKYMTPVIVLMDAYLATAAEPWRIPSFTEVALPTIEFYRFAKPYQRDEHLTRSWNPPGNPNTIHQLGGLEKQGEEGKVSYDKNNHQSMVSLRAKKIAGIAKEYTPLQIEGEIHAPLLLIGWGSTYGVLKATVEALLQEGISVALVQLRFIYPLPLDLAKIVKNYTKIIVAELNAGQLCQLLRATYLIDAKSITQCNGQPFTVNALYQAIKEGVHQDAILQA